MFSVPLRGPSWIKRVQDALAKVNVSTEFQGVQVLLDLALCNGQSAKTSLESRDSLSVGDDQDKTWQDTGPGRPCLRLAGDTL